MSVGRNEICPCGSGKKYKKCCLIKERAAGGVLTHELLSETGNKVPEILLRYAKTLYGEGCVMQAWCDFWVNPSEQEFDKNPHMQVFIPWFMYHWTPDDGEDDGDLPFARTVVAQFLDDAHQHVDGITRRYLESAQREPLSYWEVLDVSPGKGMLLRDLIAERECYVHERSVSTGMKKWAILFGQVVGMENEYVLSALGPYPISPARFRKSIEAECDRIKKGCGPGPVLALDLLGYDVDLIAHYHRCVDAMFNPVLPQIRNTDNEKLVISTTTFTFDPGDRVAIIEKLSSMRNIEHWGEKGGTAAFSWVVTKRKGGMMPTVTKGAIEVRADRMSLECNSRSRDRRLRKRVKKHLGKLIEHEGTEQKPFSLGDMPESPPSGGAFDMDDLSDVQRCELNKILDQQYMSWKDKEIPALGDKTPTQAVKTPEGREQVAVLINDWENMQAGMSESQLAFDFNRLRGALGLDLE